MKISNIKIKDSYVNTVPSEEKINECRRNWLIHGKQDRYIVVDQQGKLVDGYIMYLILKEQNVQEAEVKIWHCKRKRWKRKNMGNLEIPYYRTNLTTYIYGKHPNSNCDREYIWRIPNSWADKGKDVNVGDLVICETKFGLSPVIVARVENLECCPIERRVKKVAYIISK